MIDGSDDEQEQKKKAAMHRKISFFKCPSGRFSALS